jgi:hypothetical protein
MDVVRAIQSSGPYHNGHQEVRDAQRDAKAEVERLLSHLPVDEYQFFREYLRSKKRKSAKDKKRAQRIREKLAQIG